MAKLPNADLASIDDAKITSYLLDETHEEGGSKAAFFMSFGFDPAQPVVLADAILQYGQRHDFLSMQSSPHGEKYVIDGPLECPDGRAPIVRAVWIIDDGDSAPRFVTAYPGPRRTP